MNSVPKKLGTLKAISSWQETLLQSYEFAAEGLIALSYDKLVIAANPSAEELLELSGAQLYGKPFPYAFTNDPTFEIQRYRSDGTKTWLRIRQKPIEAGDSVSGYILSITDFTNVVEAKAAADRATEASKLKSDFLAAMSHEIRNPMTGVIGMTCLLQETSLTEEQRGYVQAIRSSGDVLLTILNDILDLSKIEAGKLVLEDTEFRLTDVLEETIGLFSEPARKKKLFLTNLVEPDVPRKLRGDSTRIRQVITNLVSNAVKFTNAGRVVVKAFVVGNSDDYKLRIEVSDTGPGLTESEVQDLFKPFHQIRRVMRGSSGGTGLGLALSRQLIEIMNGKIGVDSTKNSGSTFWFTIPISRSGESDNRAWNLESKTAMVVTCDLETGRLLSEQIKIAGSNCVVLLPSEALSALKRSKETCDVIIFDTTIDDDSLLLKYVFEKGIPTLVLCHDQNKFSTLIVQSGAVEIMSKSPLCQSQLCQRLARLLGVKDSEEDACRRYALKVATDRHLQNGEQSPRVLVVEDDPINQDVMRMMLKRLGFESDVLASGEQAIDYAGKSAYAAILMDYCLPGLDGSETTRMIREHERGGHRRTPIIATTASATSGIPEKCLQAGMNGFLTKPFTIEALATALQQHIEYSADSHVDGRSLKLLTDLSMMGESDDFLSEMINIFTKTSPNLFEKLKEAITKRDSRDIAKLAHRLKGSAGHFGAQGLIHYLEELETRAHNADLSDCEALYDKALVAFQRVTSNLQDQIGRRMA